MVLQTKKVGIIDFRKVLRPETVNFVKHNPSGNYSDLLLGYSTLLLLNTIFIVIV